MPILAIIYDVTIAVRWDEIKTNFINLLPCHVSSHSMHSTSVYGLKLSILRGTGEKTLATAHRVTHSSYMDLHTHTYSPAEPYIAPHNPT